MESNFITIEEFMKQNPSLSENDASVIYGFKKELHLQKQEGIATAKSHKDLADVVSKYDNVLKTLQDEISAFKSQSQAAGKKVDVAWYDAMTKSIFADGEEKVFSRHSKKEVISSFVKAEGDPETPAEGGAVDMTTINTGIAGTHAMGVRFGGISRSRDPLAIGSLFSRFYKGDLSEGLYKYLNEGATEGAAAWVDELEVKPYISTSVTEEEATPAMLAVLMRFSNRILKSSKEFQMFLRDVLAKAFVKKRDYDILFATGTNENGSKTVVGLTTYASAYTNTSFQGSIPFANDIDALFAAEVAMGQLGFRPDTILMDFADFMKIRLLKNENGNYIAGQVATFLESKVIICPVGFPARKIFLADSAVVGLYSHGNLSYDTRDTNKDDFEKNAVTSRLEQEYFLFVKTNEIGGIMYADLDDIQAEILKDDEVTPAP